MNARRWVRLVAAAAWAVGLTLGVAGSAAATTFSYQVDRFELDGNPRGAFDGTLDFVDEFDNGSTSPDWYRAYGTVSEHDGFMFLTDPGTVFPDPNGQPLELSIAASGAPNPQDGGGNFTGTAYWLPLLPPGGHHYHFSIYTYGNVQFFNEIIGLGFLGMGDGNYVMEQHLTEINLPQGIYQNLISVQHPINAADITGNIGMRLAFDDATNNVTTSFSLDGGATWQSPFAPAAIFNGRTYAQFILSADPVSDGVVPTTTTVTFATTTSSTTTSTTLPSDPCVPTGCRRGFTPQKATLRLRNKAPIGLGYYGPITWKWAKGQATSFAELGNPLASTTLDLCIARADGSDVFRAVFAPGSPWARSGSNSYRYRNPAGTRLMLRAAGDGKASIAFNLGLAAQPAEITPIDQSLTVRLKSSDGICWANVFNLPAKVNTRANYKAFGD